MLIVPKIWNAVLPNVFIDKPLVDIIHNFAFNFCVFSISRIIRLCYRLNSELRKWIDAYPSDNTTNGAVKFADDLKEAPWSPVSDKKTGKRDIPRKLPVRRKL